MTTLFLAQHTDDDPDYERIQLIGVFSTEKQAVEATDRAGHDVRFSGSKQGFVVSEIVLDRCDWTEGFITIRHRE